MCNNNNELPAWAAPVVAKRRFERVAPPHFLRKEKAEAEAPKAEAEAPKKGGGGILSIRWLIVLAMIVVFVAAAFSGGGGGIDDDAVDVALSYPSRGSLGSNEPPPSWQVAAYEAPQLPSSSSGMVANHVLRAINTVRACLTYSANGRRPAREDDDDDGMLATMLARVR